MSQLNKILVLLAFFASFSLAQGPVSVYGALKACTINGKGRICGSGAWENTAVQVRGVSLGWSNTGWESSRFFNAITVNAMIDGWKSEVVRVPIGSSGNGGYDSDPSNNWTRVKTSIDAAIAKDVYVVIDWHSHNANNETAAAKTFFETTVAAYHNDPHVIFEIFNEPVRQTWAEIKSYSETIISAIRAKGANNLILVGTPEYSARPSAAVGNLLADPNIAYVFHFYAYSHLTNGGDYDDYPSYSTGVTTMLNAGKPVFVTEYGTTHSDGGLDDKGHFDTHNKANSDAWFTFMDTHKISSCAWNVNDKHEGAAFFGKESSGGGSFTQAAANYTNKNMMTESGAYIYDKLTTYAPTALWRISSTPPEVGGGSEGDVFVIDDFEDGDGVSNIGEPWYIYTDAGDGGESSFANEKDEDGNTIVVFQDGDNWVAQIKDYTFVKAANEWAPYVALGLDAKDFDLSQCAEGFSYRFKGSAHNFKSQQSDVEDFAYHYYQVSPASNDDWTTVTIALSDLQQPGSWGIKVPRDMTKVEGFSWELKGHDTNKDNGGLSGLTGFLMIDDFTCHLSAPTPIARVKLASANVMRYINNGISLQLKNNAALEVFSINGSSIRKMNFSSGTHSVKFQDLPKGLYIVKVRYGNSGTEIIKMPIR